MLGTHRRQIRNRCDQYGLAGVLVRHMSGGGELSRFPPKQQVGGPSTLAMCAPCGEIVFVPDFDHGCLSDVDQMPAQLRRSVSPYAARTDGTVPPWLTVLQ